MTGFNIDICYKPGRKNNNANALSRAPIDIANNSTCGSISAITDKLVENSSTHEAQTVANTDHQDLIHQQADDCLQPIIEHVKHNTPPSTNRRYTV